MTSVFSHSQSLHSRLNTSPLLAKKMPRTTIILSDLPASVFQKNQTASLSLADEIKIFVLNSNASGNASGSADVASQIYYFSTLASLQRIVIVFNNESIASQIYMLLKSHQTFNSLGKISLSETLIKPPKSVNNRHLNIDLQKYAPLDGNFTNGGVDNNGRVDDFIANYEEPMPEPADDEKDIEDEINNDVGINNNSNNNINNNSGSGSGLDKIRSKDSSSASVNSKGSTKTLLKSMDLKIDTLAGAATNAFENNNNNDGSRSPASPLITLDNYE